MPDAGYLDSSHESPEWNRWSGLLMSYFEGEETAVALADELKKSLELRRMFVEVSLQRVAMRRVFGNTEFQTGEPISVNLPANRNLFNRMWGRLTAANRPVVWSVLACGALFAIYFAAISWGILSKKLDHSHLAATNLNSDVRSQTPAHRDASESEIGSVATLTAAEGCRWLVDGETVSLQTGIRLLANNPLHLLSGTAEITFADGAKIALGAPAYFVAEEPNRGKLDQGKLIARVPKRAIGFTIATPTTEIVDLGTEFGVEVVDGETTQVSVRKGSVRLEPPSLDAIVLTAGQSQQLSFDESGSQVVSKTVVFDFDRFEQLAVVGTKLIKGVTVLASSEFPELSRIANNVVNGSGLVGNAHTNQPNGTMWHSKLGSVEGEYLLFDLSRVHQLTQIQIWNYNERIYNLHLTRGARRVDIYASNTGKGSPDSSSDQWRLVVKDEIVSVADGTNDYATPHEIALKNVETRFLAIVFRDVHGFDPRYPGDPQKRRVGLSEVRFFGKRVPQ